MYRSRLVPRIIPVMGLIGGPLLIVAVIATLLGGLKLGSPELAALPVGAWELSLGVWLVVKGVKGSPATGWRGNQEAGWPGSPSRRPSPQALVAGR